ncbi:MAG TPA: Slp family lipoprotein [Rhodanobacter sp.]|jgi:outer membrane lipoprotein|nr:Slp family lipoprotein [Rhodanobacter sp.]
MYLYRPLALVGALALVGGCATIPQPLQGTYTNVSTSGAQQGGAGGEHVRWGGEIIKTEPGAQQTCFYLLSRPLDKQARPLTGTSGESDGRFVACRAGFYDPEVFVRGRELTVTGTLHGTVSQKVGDYDYAYPRVEADIVYLWPKRVPVTRYPAGYYDPFWGAGFGPYWGGPWGYPYWNAPRVIVVRPRTPPPPPAK